MKTLIQIFIIWLLFAIAIRAYFFLVATGDHKQVTSGTSFQKMVAKSAFFDDGMCRCRVKVMRAPVSLFTLLLLNEMEIADESGQVITVIGSFPTFNPGDEITFTGVFKQMMNNSMVHNCCIFVYVKAE